jgi:hypothetical protein
MDEYSLWHLVLFAVVVFLWVFPFWHIIGKAGYHPAISLLAIFPALGLILLWWLAFARWPIERNQPLSGGPVRRSEHSAARP